LSLLISLLSLLSFLGHANCECQSQFEIICNDAKPPFKIMFKSATGDCTNDDMEVFYVSARITKKLDIKPA